MAKHLNAMMNNVSSDDVVFTVHSDERVFIVITSINSEARDQARKTFSLSLGTRFVIGRHCWKKTTNLDRNHHESGLCSFGKRKRVPFQMKK